jgi:heptosyltransferase-2
MTHPSKYLTSAPLSVPLSNYLTNLGISKTDRLVGIHPGATWPTKRWLKERFAELCTQLKNAGFTPVLIGGPGDADLGQFIETRAHVVNLISRTNLSDLKAIIGQMRLLVTNDSGPMHLAAGLGIPVVAIFGATTKELGFFPYGDGHEVVEAELACRPCGLHGAKSCPESHFLCMRLITVEEVFAACQRVLRLAHNLA